MSSISRDKEYLEKLLELLESDKRAVMLCIALELAVPLLTIKDIAIGQTALTSPDQEFFLRKGVLILSLLLFIVAAFLHYMYYRRVHLNEFAVARILLMGTGKEARDLIFDDKTGIWAKHGWKYKGGNTCLILAVFLYLAFMTISIV